MVHLYSKPITVTYHANRITCASFCTLINLLAVIILPYVAAWGFGNLWTKELLVTEQPHARFRYEALVEAHGTSSSSELVSWSWSTSLELNDALDTALRPCELLAWEEDDERDGRPDRLQFVVRMPLDVAAGERLLSMSVVLGVDVAFHRHFQLRMNSSLHLVASSPLAGQRWQQTADLVLRSQQPQRPKDYERREPCPEPTWALQTPVTQSGGAANASTILGPYSACNDTAVLEAQPPIWTPGISSSFEAALTVHVPRILTTRKPGLVETLKLAFVQYIAMFIPIAALLGLVHGALFQTGVVASRVHHPIKQHRF